MPRLGLFSRCKELIQVASGFTGAGLDFARRYGAVKAPGRMGTRYFHVGFTQTLLSGPILTVRGYLCPLYSIDFGSLLR